jgi:hypothetical protein
MNATSLIPLMDAAEARVWVAIIGVLVAAGPAWFGWRKHRQARFDPKINATIDSGHRIRVQLRNNGTREGEVILVRLFAPEHVGQREAEVLMYRYEQNGTLTDELLTPFPLPGSQSADLVFVPDEDVDLAGLMVDVDYGGGHTSGCIPISPVHGHTAGSSRIPKK